MHQIKYPFIKHIALEQKGSRDESNVILEDILCYSKGTGAFHMMEHVQAFIYIYIYIYIYSQLLNNPSYNNIITKKKYEKL
jgi:hypothetical protein